MTQLDIELSAQCVASAIHRMCELVKSYPHFVRGELPVLSNALDDLADLVIKLDVRDAAE